MPREMRHTTGGRCRRQVWRRKTSRGAEDASGGGRCIGRRRRRRKAEEAEAEFEMERRGGRGFPLQVFGEREHSMSAGVQQVQVFGERECSASIGVQCAMECAA